MNITRHLPTFSVAFILVYAACVFFNLALFTYLPAQHAFYLFVPAVAHERGTYPMFWYGWLSTTIIGASILTFASAFAPGRIRDKSVPVLIWLSPLFATCVVFYALRFWFTQ